MNRTNVALALVGSLIWAAPSASAARNGQESRSYPVIRVGNVSGYSTGYGRFSSLPAAVTSRLAPGARVYDLGSVRLSSRPGATTGRRNADWTRSPAQTVTIDTRGINAGTREGQAALLAADSLFRTSQILGNSTSPGQAREFNARAQQVAAQVNSVAAAHTARAAEQARNDAYVRSVVAARARR